MPGTEKTTRRKMIEFVIGVLVIYVMLGGYLYYAQRSMIYIADTTANNLAATGAAAVTTETADGLELTSWMFAHAGTERRPLAIFFHGNAGNLNIRAANAVPFVESGFDFLYGEYRGYGGNPGKPSEEGLYNDARAWIAFALSRGYEISDIVLYGESLGTGVVTKMAVEYPAIRGVILQSPYTALTDVAAKYYPFYPVRWLVRDRFDSLSRIADITAPVLMIHGTRDMIVPHAHAQKLAEAAPQAELVSIEHAGHNNLLAFGFSQQVKIFLNKIK